MHFFNIPQFIKDYITKREQSFFEADIQRNHAFLTSKIQGKSVLVVGGAGTIGSSYIKDQPISIPSDVNTFFVTSEEIGQICKSACFLGASGDIYFPKLAPGHLLIKRLNLILSTSKNKSKSKPGLSGIGSIIFRDEEKLLTETTMDKSEYYAKFISPYKGELELWYQKHLSFSTDVLLIFLTVWVIVFPESQLPFKVFKDLPKRNF